MIVVRQCKGRPLPAPTVQRFLTFPRQRASWLGFFYAIYGTPDPRAPYGGVTQSALVQSAGWRSRPALRSAVRPARRRPGATYARWPGFCDLAWAIASATRGGVVGPRVPYSLVVAGYEMWWGGDSSPARFLVPILLPLAIPPASGSDRAASAARLLGLAGLAVSLLITLALAGADHGALVYNTRTAPPGFSCGSRPWSTYDRSSQLVPDGRVCDAGLRGRVARCSCGSGRDRLVVERRAGTPTHVALALGFSAIFSAAVGLSIVWLRPVGPTLVAHHGNDGVPAPIRPGQRPDSRTLSPIHRTRIRDHLPRLTIADVTPTAGAVVSRATLPCPGRPLRD